MVSLNHLCIRNSGIAGMRAKSHEWCDEEKKSHFVGRGLCVQKKCLRNTALNTLHSIRPDEALIGGIQKEV